MAKYVRNSGNGDKFYVAFELLRDFFLYIYLS